jgi:hypothetical protein
MVICEAVWGKREVMLQRRYIIPEVIPYHYEDGTPSTTIALRWGVIPHHHVASVSARFGYPLVRNPNNAISVSLRLSC